MSKKTRTTDHVKVSHVTFSLDTGGMERLLAEFAKHSANTYELEFLSLTSRGQIADELEQLGCDVTCWNKRPGFKPQLVYQLARHFRRNQTSIVHTHNSGAMLYGALAAKLAGVRVVVHSRHGQRFGATKKQTRSFALASRMVDRVVGVSMDSSKISRAEGVQEEKIRTIWNGIDLFKFPQSCMHRNGRAICVARLVPEKDHLTLLWAIKLVLRTAPDFRVDLVGDGPLFQTLANEVSRLGISHAVRLLGNRNDVPELLQRSSLFLLPSKTEGISLTLLEAMATGIPVIATNVGGNTEVVCDRISGRLVPPNDPSAMASAILQTIRDTDLQAEYVRAGRKRVESHFNVRHMVLNYERLYDEITRQKFYSKSASGTSCFGSSNFIGSPSAAIEK